MNEKVNTTMVKALPDVLPSSVKHRAPSCRGLRSVDERHRLLIPQHSRDDSIGR